MQAYRRGVLALPYVGWNSYRGDDFSYYGDGRRLGVLIGGRLNPTFSLNGELTFDDSGIENLQPRRDISEVGVDLAFSPLVHLPVGKGEVVLGPKLGVFTIRAEETFDGASVGDFNLSGYVAGINAGAFFAVNDHVALGGLLSFVLRKPTQSCMTLPGATETCNSNPNVNAAKVLGITAAALF